VFTAEKLAWGDLTEKERSSFGGCEADWHSYLRVTHKGTTLLLVSDEMQPEDVSFHRDLAWVQNMIREAYMLGYRDAVDRYGSPLDTESNTTRAVEASPVRALEEVARPYTADNGHRKGVAADSTEQAPCRTTQCLAMIDEFATKVCSLPEGHGGSHLWVSPEETDAPTSRS
jgi:hypothetical protein